MKAAPSRRDELSFSLSRQIEINIKDVVRAVPLLTLFQ